ncbi:MAG TPA: hypothetical protein VFI65_12060 [Streptosporangiaceae bacterium]|nr:hypothetical protein [Streptosporangiaceae bacterium]
MVAPATSGALPLANAALSKAVRSQRSLGTTRGNPVATVNGSVIITLRPIFMSDECHGTRLRHLHERLQVLWHKTSAMCTELAILQL